MVGLRLFNLDRSRSFSFPLLLSAFLSLAPVHVPDERGEEDDRESDDGHGDK